MDLMMEFQDKKTVDIYEGLFEKMFGGSYMVGLRNTPLFHLY